MITLQYSDFAEPAVRLEMVVTDAQPKLTERPDSSVPILVIA